MIFEEMKKPCNKEAYLKKAEEYIPFKEIERSQKAHEYIMSSQFDEDIDRLIAGDYYMDYPRQVMLRKSGSNKRRKVYSFADNDRALLSYLNYMMMDKYDGRFSDNLYSCRKHNNVADLFRSIVRNDGDRSHYVVKTDIHAYGESVDVGILLQKLKPWLDDEEELYDFLEWVLTRSRYYRNGVVEEGPTGLCPGNPVCNLLGNIYLAEADEILSERAIVYSRYTDDICIICENKEIAEENYRLLKKIIEEDHLLTLNEEKSELIVPGEAYDLLGYKFGKDFVDLSDNTFGKICSRMKHRQNNLMRRVRRGKLTREQAFQRMLSYINNQFYSTNEKDNRYSLARKVMSIITTTERLKLLDELSEDCLRCVGSGRKTNAKYRVRYEDLRKAGFRPLVHEYYHRFEEGGIFSE